MSEQEFEAANRDLHYTHKVLETLSQGDFVAIELGQYDPYIRFIAKESQEDSPDFTFYLGRQGILDLNQTLAQYIKKWKLR